MGGAFYLVYKVNGDKAKLSYNIGGPSEDSTVASVTGETVKKVFPELVSLLARYGGAYPEEVTDTRKIYVVRDDLGPVVGALVLALKRTKDLDNLLKAFERVLDGEVPGATYVLGRLTEIALMFANAWYAEGGDEKEQKALDVMASVIKSFLEAAGKAWLYGK